MPDPQNKFWLDCPDDSNAYFIWKRDVLGDEDRTPNLKKAWDAACQRVRRLKETTIPAPVSEDDDCI